jgi:hypothetical protein
MIYLMVLIIYYKYQYFLIYVWTKLKAFDSSGSENDIYFGAEGIYI